MTDPRLPEALWRAIDQAALIAPGDRLIVSVSGGPDSTALAAAMFDGRPRALGDVAVAIAHFHPGTPGADAALDLVRAQAHALRVPIFVDAAPSRQPNGAAPDPTDHNARNQFLAETARQWGAGKVLVAHTRDDQDETILMGVLGGAGLRSLGMPARRPLDDRQPPVELIRPLLGVPRPSVLAYLHARGLASLDDPHNADRSRRRIRIREDVLPYLEAKVTPQVRVHLRRLADQGRALASEAETHVRAFLQTAWEPEALPPRLNVATLRHASVALQAGVLYRVLRQLGIAARQISRSGLDDLCELLGKDPNKAIDLPAGFRAIRKGPDHLVFKTASGPHGETTVRRRAPLTQAKVQVVEPGVTAFWAFGHRFSLKIERERLSREAFAQYHAHNDPAEVYLQTVYSFTKPFSIRRLAPATKFLPLGAPGKQKLKKFLQGRGIPADRRREWPVLCDSFGRVLWVIGLEIAQDARLVNFDSHIPPAMHATLIEDDPGSFPTRLGPR